MGERDATRVVLDQLYDVLDPYPVPSTMRPRTRLYDMSFSTRGRATSTPNLCQIDIVVVEFNPIEPERGAETQVRVSGVRVSPLFHFLSEPTSPRGDSVGDNEKRATDARCARTNLDDDRYFFARHETTASSGYWWVRTVFEKAVSGENDFELTCDTYPNHQGGCEALIGEANPERLQSVERCNSEQCVIARFSGDLELTIYTERDEISRVHAAQLLILGGSQRID
jgi:hypothetical protein